MGAWYLYSISCTLTFQDFVICLLFLRFFFAKINAFMCFLIIFIKIK